MAVDGGVDLLSDAGFGVGVPGWCWHVLGSAWRDARQLVTRVPIVPGVHTAGPKVTEV